MDRQTIMETNKSLRTIKTELENLLEKGVIDDATFDTIHSSLPSETPLRGAPASAARSNNATPAHTSSVASPPPPAAAAANNQPPSYEDTPAPSLPARGGKPVIAHARALYPYAASDARDLSFEKDDKISVYEYMNQDWWMGLNARTGQEGIFPQNYVFVEAAGANSSAANSSAAKGPVPAAAYPRQQQQPAYGYPQSQGPPAQQNPYNASVPPMAIAEGTQQPQQQGEQPGGSKAGEYGKKFGKKLGNAAIFGAGASIGSNIVNSIF